MRIVAGCWKGRSLATPKGRDTRPTADRVREALFSMLTSHFGTWDDVSVLDAYAGSGALGIEALSRGASSVVFVERDARAAELVARNLAHCRVAGGYVMIRAEFTRALRQLAAGVQFDLALLDPPYDVADLGAVVDAAAGRMAPGGVMALEHATRRQAPARAGRFVAVRQLKAGDSAVTFYREAAAAPAATEEP